MGNCLSSKAVPSSSSTPPATNGRKTNANNNRERRLPSDVTTSSSSSNGEVDASLISSSAGNELSSSSHSHHGNAMAALVHAVMPIVLPKARRAICKHLIEGGFVTLNGEPMLGLDDENGTNDEGLPLRPIEAHADKMRAVDAKTLIHDMEAAPQFRWPVERDRATELMKNVPGIGAKMAVLDLIGFSADISLGEGIELAFPVEGPDGVKATIEVGSRRGTNEPCIRIIAPKLRVWFVNEAPRPRKLFVAFMEQPNVTTNLYTNVDRGNGDLDDIVAFDGTGSLDCVIKRLLYRGFGPGTSPPDRDGDTPMDKCNSILVVDAIGKKIAEAVGDYEEVENGGRPLEILLESGISSVDEAAATESRVCTSKSKPRTEAEIRADIESLQKELALLKARRKPMQSDEDDKSLTEENSMSERAADENGNCLLSCLGDIRICFQQCS